MKRLDLILGFSNIFAFPFAISIDRDDDWGSTVFALHVGPFVIGFEWWSA